MRNTKPLRSYTVALLCYNFTVQAVSEAQAKYKALRKLDAMLGIKDGPKRTTLTTTIS